MGDSESYWALASDIAEGKPYEYGPDHARVFRTPGYPLLLAPILRLAGDGPNGGAAGPGRGGAVGRLGGARPCGGSRGCCSTIAPRCWRRPWRRSIPGAIALECVDPQRGPLLPADVAATCAYGPSPGGRGRPAKATLCGFCGGLAAGAATLMRPSWLLFTPLAAAWEC